MYKQPLCLFFFISGNHTVPLPLPHPLNSSTVGELLRTVGRLLPTIGAVSASSPASISIPSPLPSPLPWLLPRGWAPEVFLCENHFGDNLTSFHRTRRDLHGVARPSEWPWAAPRHGRGRTGPEEVGRPEEARPPPQRPRQHRLNRASALGTSPGGGREGAGGRGRACVARRGGPGEPSPEEQEGARRHLVPRPEAGGATRPGRGPGARAWSTASWNPTANHVMVLRRPVRIAVTAVAVGKSWKSKTCHECVVLRYIINLRSQCEVCGRAGCPPSHEAPSLGVPLSAGPVRPPCAQALAPLSLPVPVFSPCSPLSALLVDRESQRWLAASGMFSRQPQHPHSLQEARGRRAAGQRPWAARGGPALPGTRQGSPALPLASPRLPGPWGCSAGRPYVLSPRSSSQSSFTPRCGEGGGPGVCCAGDVEPTHRLVRIWGTLETRSDNLQKSEEPEL